MKRVIFESIKHFILQEKTHSILMIEGARQVGKTYAVEKVLENIKLPQIRINLEKNRILREQIDKTSSFDEYTFLLKDQFGFKENDSQIIFIDEAQESQKLGAYVRFMKEEWSNKKVLLTGSSLIRLFREDQRVPVGRFSRIKIGPFTFLEYLRFLNREALIEQIEKFNETKPITNEIHHRFLKEFDTYLTVGGMPQVLEAFKNKEDYQTIRRDIILSQKEDFIRKSSIADGDLFDSCLSAVANHVGSPSKYSYIGSNFRLAKQIVSIMKQWHLVLEVKRQGVDPNKGDYLPKRYLYDVGLLHEFQSRPFKHVSLLDALHPDLRTYLGGVLENCLFIELTTSAHNFNITTWKENASSNKEVDFVIEREGHFIPIECKAQLKITPRSFKNVQSYLQLAHEKKGYVVSSAPFTKLFHNAFELINMPVYLLSLI